MFKSHSGFFAGNQKARFILMGTVLFCFNDEMYPTKNGILTEKYVDTFV